MRSSISKNDVSKAVQLLINMGSLYSTSTFDKKNLLTGSIFPEGFEISNSKCRTTRENEVFALLTKLRPIIKKKATKIGGLSHMAPLQGLEPWTL